MVRLVILASGTGSNAQAIWQACQQGQLPACVVGVAGNRPQALVMQKAQSWNVPHWAARPQDCGGRQAFEAALLSQLHAWQPDLVVLAGFMLQLSGDFLRMLACPVMNIHPSLLPKYPGLHAIERALAAQEKYTGCTVHWVDEGLDTGAIIAQSTLALYPDDTPSTVAQRLHPLEHALYVQTIAHWIASQPQGNKL